MDLSRFIVLWIGIGLLAVGVASAAPDEWGEEVLSARGVVSVDKAARGTSFQIAVEADIAPGWHVNAHAPTDEFLVPTDLVLEASSGILLGRIAYPPPVERTFAFSGRPMAVYEGRVLLGSTASVSESAPLGPGTIRMTLTYQACNDETCLPPREVHFETRVEIVPAGTPVTEVHSDLFESLRGEVSEPERRGGRVEGMIRERGLFLGFLMVFVWGLGLNLTPCVYPMIPLTVGYFGAQSEGRMSARAVLAVAYFLGIALMYSTLGVVAAGTGGLFGAALQSPVVLAAVAAVLVSLALSMFGVWEIRLPAFLMRAGGGARRGIVGAFVMGLTVGIVAAPCVGAVVAALLIYVAETGDLLLGFWLFFALSCGLGFPFLVLAIFSSSISSLPRSGEWMAWVRKLFGVVLVGMAVYFLRPVLPGIVGHYLLVLTAAVGACYLGFIDRTQSSSRGFSWTKRVVGVVGIGLVVWLLMAKKEVPTIRWEPYSDQAYSEALDRGRPVIIEFSAEWCIPCHELERYTFSDPRVLERSRNFETLRVDFTRSGNASERVVREKFRIVGVPTIVFVARGGQEIVDLRVEGFIEPDEFLAKLEALAGRRRASSGG